MWPSTASAVWLAFGTSRRKGTNLEKSSNRVGRCQSRSPMVWIFIRSSSFADSRPMPGMRVTGRSSDVAGGSLVVRAGGAVDVTMETWCSARINVGKAEVAKAEGTGRRELRADPFDREHGRRRHVGGGRVSERQGLDPAL